jgi:hypothetical protein
LFNYAIIFENIKDIPRSIGKVAAIRQRDSYSKRRADHTEAAFQCSNRTRTHEKLRQRTKKKVSQAREFNDHHFKQIVGDKIMAVIYCYYTKSAERMSLEIKPLIRST